MVRRVAAALAALSLALVAVSAAERRALTAADVMRRMLPRLLTVYALDAEGRVVSQGSGVLWSFDGEVGKWMAVTNYHVISLGRHIGVKAIGSESIFNATVTRTDAQADVAVLHVDFTAEHAAKIARLGLIPFASGPPEIGTRVYAIGTPKGYEGTISEGIVSGIREFGALYLVQTTAPISHGSSGGPLVNERGQLVGLTTLTRPDGQSLNFAVPVDFVVDTIIGLRGFSRESWDEIFGEVDRNTAEKDASDGGKAPEPDVTGYTPPRPKGSRVVADPSLKPPDTAKRRKRP